MQAAKYLGMSLLDLLDAPVAIYQVALAAMKAEADAEEIRNRREARRKQKPGR